MQILHRTLQALLLFYSIFSICYPNEVAAQSQGSLSFDDFQDRKAEDIRPQDVINWEGFSAVPHADGTVVVTARMTAKQDWTIYADNLTFTGPAGFTVSRITPPPARLQKDPITGKDVDVYAGGEFEIGFQGAVAWEGSHFPFSATYVGCTQVICLFPHTQEIAAVFTPASTAASLVPVSAAANAEPASPPSTAAQGNLESRLAQQLTAGGLSYGALLLIVFIGGILSNLTPCVYPMVPITLRVLSRQGHSPFVSAGLYAFGIVLTYTSLGIVAAMSGGMFGSLLASKSFNLIFAIIMAVLGLTMLGFGNFSKLQSIGSRLGSGKPSLGNTFLMGTGAGLVAAPCTGPILAALLVSTARTDQDLLQSSALMFSYSLGFGLPYVFLGGAAATVSKIRVRPQVQVAVKMLFASVMFGLSLYYLRIPLYSMITTLRPYWGMVAALGLLVGLLLTTVWVLSARLQNNKTTMILPTMILAVGIFAGSQYATSVNIQDPSQHVSWIKVEQDALDTAKASGKPILIDMWAEWCEACKQMDASTFLDPQVVQQLQGGWVTLKLDLTESTPETDSVQERYQISSLPTLVLLPPDGDVNKMDAIIGYVNGAQLSERLNQFVKRAE